MMKKTFLLMALMLLTVGSMQAQSLYGKWQTDMSDDEMNAQMFFTFSQSGTCDMSIAIVLEDDEMGSMEFLFTLPGTFTRTGDQLHIELDKSRIQMKLGEMKWKGEMAEMAKDPATKELIENMLKAEMEKQKNDKANEFPDDLDCTIKQLTSTTLELEEDNDIMTFKRV